MIARQQKETADLAARHQAQLKQLPPDAPATEKEQLQKVQQEETHALEVRQQQERDQLDKRYRKPGG